MANSLIDLLKEVSDCLVPHHVELTSYFSVQDQVLQVFQKYSGISLASLNKIRAMKDAYEFILVYYLIKTGIAKKETQDSI